MVSVLVLRSVSACALPRPSAMASAKLANSTVNHSQSAIWKLKPPMPRAAGDSRATARTVVMAAPTSTTNITGFFISVARIQLDEGIDDGALDDGRVEERARARSPSSGISDDGRSCDAVVVSW